MDSKGWQTLSNKRKNRQQNETFKNQEQCTAKTGDIQEE